MPGPDVRALPSVDRLLHTGHVEELLARYSREAVLTMVRGVLAEERAAVLAGRSASTWETIARTIQLRAESAWSEWPQATLNATGVLLHTNLGRAPLSAEAVTAMARAAAYSDLELNLDTGERGSRQGRLAQLLTTLLPATGAHVVVNAAAAVTLALAALARGKEVIVSRGQAVEIGGGFRVPVILRESGARLLEVGTTNRTRIQDYGEAIGPHTGAILHVHSSNFRMVGFAETVALQDLAALGRRAGVPVLVDNGSGTLLDTVRFGLEHEPMPAEALDAGVDLVAFSGDKLLGGPQAGILVGRNEVVARLARHPLSRALRPDKVILAGLFATLMAYIQGDAVETLPLWRMISQDEGTMRERARAWQRAAGYQNLRVDLTDGESTIGGGSLPGETLPTTLLVLPRGISAARLRKGQPPVLARTRQARTLLDLRTIPPESEKDLLHAVLDAVPPR